MAHFTSKQKYFFKKKHVNLAINFTNIKGILDEPPNNFFNIKLRITEKKKTDLKWFSHIYNVKHFTDLLFMEIFLKLIYANAMESNGIQY